MTVDEDNRPFEKATKENAHEHGAVTSVKRPMYDKDIEIKTRVTAVLEKVEMVSQCNVSIKESCNQASTVFTSELTEDKTEKCRFSLPSKGEEKVNSFEQISQKSNAICTKNDILLVDPYDFSRSHQGYMVIIVNQTFKHQAFRDGAFKDIEYLYNIAYKLGLNVYKGQNTNLSLSETLQLLENVRTLDHSHCNMLAVAFSTHGLEQPNPKAKGKSDHALVCADDRLIFTSTVTEIFNDDNCPSLKDKPKLFIIQACRGEEHDNGADLWVTKKTGVDRTCGGYADNCWQTSLETPDVHFTNDSWAGGPDNQGQSAHLLDDHTITPGNESSALPMVTQIQSAQLLRAPLRSSPKLKPFPLVDTPSLKCENDQLIFYAIPPGMFAWRNTEDGSWMLYYLNNLIEMCDERRPINMLKLLLKVNAEMALRTTNVPSDKNLDRKKAISVVEHKLTRDLIFPSRVK
ncbi:uncharacterized protein LOC127866063 [Dreissena polymorpha]|uniref:Caspase-3 n=1 Tax=Dreissena polymorpha TaxID=45954 RepID=A0A9D4LPN6_DREPO|nr:uncharacterized protein LOC127866063 [Dreissena polymorpha]KAH3861895.1 hypothetical protein DPMN_024849 [Dreissena polymorpha]